MGTEVATETRRSTAARSVTGASKVIEMGMATPTVWPSVGRMLAISRVCSGSTVRKVWSSGAPGPPRSSTPTACTRYSVP